MNEHDINCIVKREIDRIENPDFKKWFLNHRLSSPKKILLKTIEEKNVDKAFWLITENNGVEDAGYRIVHSDTEEKMFGLEVTDQNEQNLFLGFYGDLNETLENI